MVAAAGGTPMKAVLCTKYGPPEVLQLVEVAKPTPKANEVLIKVYATTVSIGDVRMRRFSVPRAQWLFARLYLGVLKPKRAILGMELAGDIEAMGENVTQFKVGDSILASTFNVDFGGYAEYKCMPEDGLLVTKPAALSYGEAAASVGGALTAMRCLPKAQLQHGQKVLIYGASGAVGANAVQLASRHFGAEVTGVCSTVNLELVKSLGAAHVIDYTREDFSQAGAIYDVVFDAVAKFPASQAKKALKSTGMYLNVHRDSGSGRLKRDDLLALKALIEAGKLKPVIDRCYPLEQIVEAHRYVEQGHKKGNVVITVAQAT
jgi:NADPH:quinone reductase-like Zn-dependent oxidoreductase